MAWDFNIIVIDVNTKLSCIWEKVFDEHSMADEKALAVEPGHSLLKF